MTAQPHVPDRTNMRPPDYAQGYGELVRAHRLYMGISQRTLSRRMKMAEKSFSDIEVGRRHCPPGFVDEVAKVCDEFDAAVEAIITAVEQDPRDQVNFDIDSEPRNEWTRAVVGRAAVQSARIMPMLVCESPTTRERSWTARN